MIRTLYAHMGADSDDACRAGAWAYDIECDPFANGKSMEWKLPRSTVPFLADHEHMHACRPKLHHDWAFSNSMYMAHKPEPEPTAASCMLM